MASTKGTKAKQTARTGLAWFPQDSRITKPAYNRLLVSAVLFHEGPESRVGYVSGRVCRLRGCRRFAATCFAKD